METGRPSAVLAYRTIGNLAFRDARRTRPQDDGNALAPEPARAASTGSAICANAASINRLFRDDKASRPAGGCGSESATCPTWTVWPGTKSSRVTNPRLPENSARATSCLPVPMGATMPMSGIPSPLIV
jgi:hypothetical protein